ncbi:MAG: CbbX protein, partial [Candidatus Limnocylindria bacterium]
MPEQPNDEAAATLDSTAADSGVEDVLARLDRDLVGLVPVKTRIREIAALLLVEKLRAE